MTHRSLSDWLTHSRQTQTAFAADLGVHPSTLSRFLSGQATPSLDVAVRIERLTGGVVRPCSFVENCALVAPAAPAGKSGNPTVPETGQEVAA